MSVSPTPAPTRAQRLAQSAMAACLAVMALAVFVNVVLRYGFGIGIAASEELSRLLFVWMVFIGAAASYPAGEHMAITSQEAQHHGCALLAPTVLIRLLVLLACVLKVVLGYPTALLPLPALLCAIAIGVMALVELLRRTPLNLGHAADVE